MKTLVLGLLFLGLTNLTFSQNELAYTKVNSKTTFKTATINSAFINSFTSTDISKRILSFQKTAADYDITTNPVYRPNNPSTYTVVFKEANNLIENLYSHSGEILSSNQTFTDIRLPYNISSKITMEHQGWAINHVECHIAYTQGEPVNIVYKVKLKNGDQTKTLRIAE
ncbi:MAG TPA: hypothetical protein VKN14_10440 [Flavobacteriaceae bacterium]|nr:hypothetical protein [Flavobacteriaceae bacterium]